MEAATGTAEPVEPVETGGRAVARHSALIVVAGLAGKALALVRDVAIGSAFGAGASTDALFLALSLPSTFASVVAGGGFRVAFQPELIRRLDARAGSAWSLFTLLLAVLGLGSLALMAALMGASGPLARWLSPGTPELPGMLVLLAPMLPLMVVLDLFTGALHARLRFAWPALEAAVRNGAIVACALGLSGLGIVAVGFGHLVGTLVVVAGCIGASRAIGFRLVRPAAGDPATASTLFRQAIPAILGSSIYPLWALTDRTMGLSLGPGASSALAFADPLWQAGLVVAGPVSVVALPILAGLAARGDVAGFAATVRSTTRGTVFLTLPLAALLAALAEPAVHLLYLRGRFGPEAASLTAQALEFLALCLPTAAAQGVTMRALQARGQFAATGRIALAVVGLHALLNWPLMAWLGHRGIALSSVVTGLVLVALLDRELALPSPGRARFLGGLAASALAAFACARGLAGAVPALPSPMVDAVVRLAAGGLGGLAAFLLVARVARMDELAQVLRFVRRRR